MIDWRWIRIKKINWKIKGETLLACVIALIALLSALSIVSLYLQIRKQIENAPIETTDWKASYRETTSNEEKALIEVEIWKACCISRHEMHSETLRQLGLDKPARPGMDL